MPGSRYLYNRLNHMQHLLYPPYCLLCGRPGARQRDLCGGCLEDLPWLSQGCTRCGAPLPGRGEVCGVCLRHPPAFDVSIIPFAYRAPLDRLILQLKFAQKLAVAPLLGRLLADALLRQPVAFPECLLPVPMHPARLRQRGYNQALELARVVGRHCGIPLAPTLASRQRDTPMQSRLSGSERRRNLKHAFAVRSGPLPRHVALVDDVVTTGSTVNELARSLKAAGVVRVDVWACARA